MSRLDTIGNWPKLAEEANWSVAALAKTCGVCVRTLERYFFKTFRQSPKGWVTGQRQKQAAELLQSHRSVKETAGLVGYAHASTFSREFKKQAGQCPHVLAKPSARPGELNCNIKIR